MRGIILFSIGAVAGFCIACYSLNEDPSYALYKGIIKFVKDNDICLSSR